MARKSVRRSLRSWPTPSLTRYSPTPRSASDECGTYKTVKVGYKTVKAIYKTVKARRKPVKASYKTVKARYKTVKASKRLEPSLTR